MDAVIHMDRTQRPLAASDERMQERHRIATAA
jgi:hypothetical protein